MISILSKARDGHLSIRMNPKNSDYQYFTESRAISPYKFKISREGKVYAIPNRYISYFSKDIQNAIINNKNIEVSKINFDNKVLEPLDYILGFNNGYKMEKSEQTQFIRNQIIIEDFNFFRFPLSGSLLKNIEIVYSDETNIKFDYLVLRPKIISSSLFQEFKSYMLYNDNEEKKLNTNLYELSKEFLIKNNLILVANNIIWDKFTINGEFKCKVDKINEINVIYQNSF